MDSISNNGKEAAEAIRNYVKPIFGFALNRVKHRAEAEDLAQEIMLQLLKSFSGARDIRSLDAYVWTVARYTWVNWLKKREHAPQVIEINGMSELSAAPSREPLDRLLATEASRELRREVAFLSDIHRRIVVMHYYDELKIGDIAIALNIPVGTVKWHLSEAKKKLRKGMKRMRTTGTLSVNPVSMGEMGHSGSAGSLGETNDFLGRALAQNIVYAAYHKARTVHQIAEELGMPPSLLEGEVRHLADYNFLLQTSPGKYQSNTIVWDLFELAVAGHQFWQDCAAEVADVHFDALMEVRRQVEDSGVYVPDDDYNFLLWTLLPKNIEEQSWRSMPAGENFDAVAPMRKDGGQYIAYAALDRSHYPDPGFDMGSYVTFGPSIRYVEDTPLYLWQFNTYWSDRETDWRFLEYRNVEICHAFQQGELPDNEDNAEQYSFLLEKGYIRKTKEGYKFNAVWFDSPQTLDRLNKAMPDLSALYAPAVGKLYDKMLNLFLQNQPKHLEPQLAYMVRGNTGGGRLVAYILKHLIDNGKLKPPLPHQQKTISTWMGPVK
ncbi:RNA polymerase sigma factor [Paenibacillus polysaccharolyticus]|uniref:RNA polymerase sigma factor n=1 Tax=Paenibacillus polysaccharolyticus TaxID=582692 RepID=UPI002040170C|nr:RNA polymerase sigma factor [Paenibacillus polysaccharolyticus]MCM3133539.1 RNA polymerase sigma factor [Paenibacillus polysaccharolyticus]